MIHLPLDREALLAEALRRVDGRRDIGRAFDRLGPARSELADCLQAALACVQQLARPAAAVVCARLPELGRELTGIDALAGHEALEARGFVYLVTCGYDSRDALAWLQGDYTSYHLQDAISRELVFAIGREVSRWLRAERPDWRFTRQVLRDGSAPAAGGARRWDPRRIAPLLSWFDNSGLGVGTTTAGVLIPLHSVLGVMLGKPATDTDGITPPTAAAQDPVPDARRAAHLSTP